MAKDMTIKYYDKRDTIKDRKYYNNIDEIFKDKGRFEYLGKHIILSWLGIKNVEFDV